MKDITYKTKRLYKDVVKGIRNRGFDLFRYGDCYNRETKDWNGRTKTQVCYAIYINRKTDKAISLEYLMERDYSQRDTLIATRCLKKEDYTDSLDWEQIHRGA